MKAIPHLNELDRQFAGRPVRIVSVTDEDESIVKRFLGIRPLGTMIGFDKSRRLHDAFGVKGIPVTFLINAQGKVVARTSPENLTAVVLERLEKGEPPGIEGPKLVEAAKPQPAEAPPILEVIIRGGAGQGSSMSFNPSSFKARNMKLRDAVALAYDFRKTRVDLSGESPDAKYNMEVKVPPSEGFPARQMLQHVLESAFHLRVRREQRESDVYELRRIEGQEPDLQPAEKSWAVMSSELSLSTKGARIESLCGVLEGVLGQPVFDETGFEGRFAYSLYWDENRPASILDELRKQLRLELVPAKRTVEVLAGTVK